MWSERDLPRCRYRNKVTCPVYAKTFNRYVTRCPVTGLLNIRRGHPVPHLPQLRPATPLILDSGRFPGPKEWHGK